MIVRSLPHNLYYAHFIEGGPMWEHAREAILRHRLYVNSWCIRAEVLNGSIKEIVLAYDGITPVGCFTLTYGKHSVFGSCYVRRTSRRMGIGTQLYKTMKQYTEHSFKVVEGVSGSATFWKELGEDVNRECRYSVA